MRERRPRPPRDDEHARSGVRPVVESHGALESPAEQEDHRLLEIEQRHALDLSFNPIAQLPRDAQTFAMKAERLAAELEAIGKPAEPDHADDPELREAYRQGREKKRQRRLIEVKALLPEMRGRAGRLAGIVTAIQSGELGPLDDYLADEEVQVAGEILRLETEQRLLGERIEASKGARDADALKVAQRLQLDADLGDVMRDLRLRREQRQRLSDQRAFVAIHRERAKHASAKADVPTERVE